MMKKIFTAILMGAVSMGLLSGCAFCRKPQLDSCVPPQADHTFSQTIAPSPVTIAQPIVLPSGDVFRPVFRADAKRVIATGIGDSPEEARNNSVVNFIKDNKCDHIVAASFTYEETIHPSWKFWKFFRSNSYAVKLTGIPVRMDSLIREKAPKTAEFNAPLPTVKLD